MVLMLFSAFRVWLKGTSRVIEEDYKNPLPERHKIVGRQTERVNYFQVSPNET